jgi:hypothetical protein
MNDLLDSRAVDEAARRLRLSTPGAVTLLATAHAVRSIAEAGAWGDWALGGPTALLGVYLRDRRLHRVPEELTLIPAEGRKAKGEAAFASAAAAVEAVLLMAFPGAAPMAPDPRDPDVRGIRFAGPMGQAELRVRFDGTGRQVGVRSYLPGDHRADSAAWSDRGAIADERLPYFLLAGRPVPEAGEQLLVPVARAEEVLLRALLVIAGSRPGSAFRIDDLRLAVEIAPEAVEQCLPTMRAFIDNAASSPEKRAQFLEQVRAAARTALVGDRGSLPGPYRPETESVDGPAAFAAVETLIGGLR